MTPPARPMINIGYTTCRRASIACPWASVADPPTELCQSSAIAIASASVRAGRRSISPAAARSREPLGITATRKPSFALSARRRSAPVTARNYLVEHELVLIEGAGSPAEINLRDSDLANMRTAKAADARVILVADIDRGGAFAHLYGTWALLGEDERALINGFVLNKFRGDRSLLPPAPEQLEQLTGVPTIGVLPWLDHGLPDEDGAATPPITDERRKVAVIRYPTASNLDEFKQLEQVAELGWVFEPGEAEGADLLILPGSKHVAADLAWLAHTGLAKVVRAHARRGQPVLGICGGMQMLGERVDDEAGVDGSAEGLALLPLRTVFAAAKQTQRTSARFRALQQPWAALSGTTLTGYQIRHGHTNATSPDTEALPDGLGFISGPVLGIYLHGLFEQPELLQALFGASPRRSLGQAFDELADAAEEHLDVAALLQGAGVI